MKPLEPPDSLHLQAAQGWCELHAFLEADAEPDKITAKLRAHPSVLEVRWQVFANIKQWDMALDIASDIVAVEPDWANGWIYKASSLTELNRQKEAYETLRVAATLFPKHEIIPYDLACVCCALKRLDEAKAWLAKAIAAGGNAIKLKALDDTDLEPLWGELKS